MKSAKTKTKAARPPRRHPAHASRVGERPSFDARTRGDARSNDEARARGDARTRGDARSNDDAATERVHGLRAGLAVLSKRPHDVLRVACVRELVDEVEGALGPHAEEVHIELRSEREIEHLAHSTQHEGLVLEARARPWTSPLELADRLVRTKGVALALDRVRNSYNIGAILRSAAFFGVDAAVLGAPAPHPGLDPNAVRVAEGGVEHLSMTRTTDLADTLGRLRGRGVHVFGADGHATLDALEFAFPRPAILVMGNEREGLGARVRAQCDALLAIRGNGSIESLNVGVAAALLVARLTRPF